MSKILFCAVDDGAYGATAPVASVLGKRGYDIHWMVEPNSRAHLQLAEKAANVRAVSKKAELVSEAFSVLRVRGLLVNS